MELGKNVGIKPLSNFYNKTTNNELDKLLYDINDKLYFFSTLFVNIKVKNYLLKEIENTANSVKSVSGVDKRKAEFITKLRDVYSTLKKYHDNSSTADSVDKEERMNGYLVAKYLKDKKNVLTIEQKLEWIKTIKYFSDFYPVFENLKSVQVELLKEFFV